MWGFPSPLSRLSVSCIPEELLAASLSKAHTNQCPDGRTHCGARPFAWPFRDFFKTLGASPHPSFFLPLLIPCSVILRLYATPGHC